MSTTPRPGRIDPTVRGLLRGFVSPALADRWAARLQPIAVADHRAAVTGAVSLLLDEAGVDPADLTVALVEDVGWSSPDAGALLGMTALEVRMALAAGGRATPRRPRHHLEPRLLPGRAPTGDPDRRDVAPPDDVELRSRLPRRPPETDQRPALLLVVVLLLGLAAFAARVGAPPAGQQDLAPVTTPSPGAPPSDGPTPSPSATPSPSPRPDGGQDPPPDPEGPALQTLRLVAAEDVLAGDPDPAGTGTTFDDVDDVRVWGSLDRPSDEAVVVRVAVTAPDGGRSVRPVLVPAGVRSFALSLPAELGEQPGRWLVTAVLGDGEVLRREAQLRATDGP